MAKRKIKTEAITEQEGKCANTGKPLPENLSLVDAHRPEKKCQGGEYTKDNTTVSDPVAHMKEHGNYRERENALEELKAIVDDRQQTMKFQMKINNQLLAYERRTDTLFPETLERLEALVEPLKKDMSVIDRKLTKAVKELAKHDPLVATALNVKGIGEVTVAYCTIYIDLEKARHASSLWKYAGLHQPSHDRYTKGEASGGNKSLRTVLYTMAESQMKGRNRGSAYGYLYDLHKTRLENSDRLVKTRNTKGDLVTLPWKDTKPSHRHGAAYRKIMKMFLADYWIVGRTMKGLPTDLPYAEAILGKNHKTIHPRERGWVYEDTSGLFDDLDPVTQEEMKKVADAKVQKKPTTVKHSPKKPSRQPRIKAK